MSSPNIVRQSSHPFLAEDNARVILPEHASPSITAHSGGIISYEHSEHRIAHIVQVQLVMGELSKQLGCRFEPHRVIFQGGMSENGDHGRHLAHLSSFKDDRFQRILKNIEKDEKLNEEDIDFLEARNINSPTREGLLQAVREKENLEEFIANNISPTKLETCLSRTYLECYLNATDSSPALANQFDSIIEHHIRPIAIKLLDDVSEEKLTPEEGTLELITKLRDFCDEALPNLRKRIDDLGTLQISLGTLRHLPTASKNEAKVFVEQTRELLRTKAILAKPERGAPGINGERMQTLHADWKTFQKIAKLNVNSEDFIEHFHDLEAELEKGYPFESAIKDIRSRFEGYITEAGYQFQAATCASKESVHELRTLIFGNSKKESPNPKRMYTACLDIVRPYYNNHRYEQNQNSPEVVLNSMSETPSKQSPSSANQSPLVSSPLSPVRQNFKPKSLFQSPVKKDPVVKKLFATPEKLSKKRGILDQKESPPKRQQLGESSSDIDLADFFSSPDF